MSDEALRARLMHKHADEVAAFRAQLDRQADHWNHGGYLSTGCLHGDHDYCQATSVPREGRVKVPSECKFCSLKCSCDCHMGDEEVGD